MNVIALIALEPPSAFPRGKASARLSMPAIGSVRKAQSYCEPRSDTQRPGVVTAGSASAEAPASSTITRTDGSAERRYASTQPAEPAPTIT